MTDDATLLRRHATERSEEAFAEFVRRHLPMVYAAAFRRLGGDAHRAEDIAQVVFCAVARDAEKLSRHAVLTGWLYTATRNAVIDVVRTESRRRAREEEAHARQVTLSDDASAIDWSRLRPVLDAAMDELGDDDRDAVLLRYFQGRTFAEIGAALGASEEAARKRVDRALDKLRGLLGRHKIASTSAALATVLATETTLAAPAGLAASVTGAALAAGGAAAAGTTAFFALTKLQAALAAAVVGAGAVGLITQQRAISTLRENTATAEQRMAALASENATLATARAAAEAEAAKLRVENAALAQTAATSARTVAGGAIAASGPSAAGASTRPPGAAASDAQKASWHRRFDPFVQQRGYPPALVERLIELWFQQEGARADLQASVTAAGLRGDARGVEALRAKLYAPITRELRDLMGPEAHAAYLEYERTSYYRFAAIDSLQPAFAKENVPLSPEQADRLAGLVAANDRPVRVNATDIGTESRFDWKAVAAQAGDILTPEQLAVLRAYASRQRPGH